MNNPLLPIGSVVRIQDSEDASLIIGYFPEDDERSYDYLATPFPQGMLEVPYVSAFDEDVIEEVVFRGYQDETGEEALLALQQLVELRGQVYSDIAREIYRYSRENPEAFAKELSGGAASQASDSQPAESYSLE